MKNYLGSGDQITIPAPSGGCVSGVPFKSGKLLCVPKVTAAVGVMVACAIAGLFKLDKATGTAWTVGTKLYWNSSTSKATTSASGNLFIGYAAAAAASDATTGEVLLLPAPDEDAADLSPVVVPVTIGDADTTLPAHGVSPIAGTIEKIWSVVQADATGAAATAAEVTVTTKIGATNITNGVLTIASGAAIGEIDSATPTAANEVDEGDLLVAVGDGDDTNDHPITVFFVIRPN